MVKKTSAKHIDHSKYTGFADVSKNFEDASKLAFDFGYYNAAGVLIIHSAIALADSVTTKIISLKVSGESHYDILSLLRNILPEKYRSKTAFDHLEKLIDFKNVISYSGEVFHKKDIEKLNKHFERFASWANQIIIN